MAQALKTVFVSFVACPPPLAAAQALPEGRDHRDPCQRDGHGRV
jgi:hypothetical protein